MIYKIASLHKPVMVREVVDLLVVHESGIYIDSTLGIGGHAEAILQQLGSSGCVVGIDRDEEALAAAKIRLRPWQFNCRIIQSDFSDMAEISKRLNIKAVDGVLMDLGVSSMQLDDVKRGFSFMHDAPLDMRMDRQQTLTASDLIRSLGEQELASLIREFGEERFSGRIAQAITRSRVKHDVLTTKWLADLVCRVHKGRRVAKHPATRTFQALRIAVNRELEQLSAGLEQGISWLKLGGRMVVISYHSLEDRCVKQAFKRHVGLNQSMQEGGKRWVGSRPPVQWVCKKPITPSPEEISENPRARSAKLRVIERTQ